MSSLLLAFLLAAPVPSGAAPSENRRIVTLIAGGDVTLGYHFEELFDAEIVNGKPQDEMLAYPFAKVRPALAAADIAVVNLECPFTVRGEKLTKNFNFRAKPALAGAVAAAGIDVVSLANNHLMDYGLLGLLDTLEALDKAGVRHFGAGRTLAEARQPAIVTRNGLRVAFLGYFFLGDRNIEPREVLATATTPGVAGTYKDLAAMKTMLVEDLAAARGKADLVVPFFHWGREASHEIEGYQVELARLAVRSGARVVLGAHPHVLQAMASVNGVPVAYSLGNFVFGGNSNPRVKDSALFKVTLSPGGALSTEVLPIQVTRMPDAPFQPFLLDGEEKERVLKTLALFPRGGAGELLPSLSPFGQ
jgi:poly-gamma-glutamate synthesis protein (capsule biosynthesis protein)